MNATKIPYLTHTLNLWAGCTHCSPGCDNCWAETMAGRLAAMGKQELAPVVTEAGPRARWTGKIHYYPERLEQLREGRKPRVVGLNFMTDTFHPAVDRWRQFGLFDEIDSLGLWSGNIFVIATKRADEMRQVCEGYAMDEITNGRLPNLVFLLTVCNQAEADAKIPLFLECRRYFPYSLFGLSIEPMLGRIDLAGEWLEYLDWVIIGCESGPTRRLIENVHMVPLLSGCAYWSCPVYVKQWHEDGKVVEKPSPDYLQVPERLKG